MSGYPVLLGAVVLTSANRTIRIREGATTSSANIGTGTYYLRGNGGIDDLCFAIQSALAAAGASANTYTVTMSCNIDPASPTVLLTITRATGADDFSIVVDGSTTFDMDLIGIPATTAHDATAKTSTASCAATWVGNDILREREPFGERIVSVPRRASGGTIGVSRSDHMTSWALGFAFLHEDRTLKRVNTTDPDATLEAFVERFGAGALFEGQEVAIASGTTLAAMTSGNRFARMHWSEDSLTTFRPRRLGPGVPLYDIDLVAHEQVTP